MIISIPNKKVNYFKPHDSFLFFSFLSFFFKTRSFALRVLKRTNVFAEGVGIFKKSAQANAIFIYHGLLQSILCLL